MNVEDRLRMAAAGVGAPEFDAQRFADRALEEDLVDVAYARADSPLGALLVAATPRGLACVSYLDFRQEEKTLANIAARLSPRVVEAPARLDDIRRQLDDYFSGRRLRAAAGRLRQALQWERQPSPRSSVSSSSLRSIPPV